MVSVTTLCYDHMSQNRKTDILRAYDLQQWRKYDTMICMTKCDKSSPQANMASWFWAILFFQGGENSDPKESTSVHRRLYQPHPLPMPEYGGWFAPLTEFLPSPSVPIATFHRCNMAVVLLTDLVVDCQSVDWSVHIPLVGSTQTKQLFPVCGINARLQILSLFHLYR